MQIFDDNLDHLNKPDYLDEPWLPLFSFFYKYILVLPLLLFYVIRLHLFNDRQLYHDDLPIRSSIFLLCIYAR